MARLTAPNGATVSADDELVDRLVSSGFKCVGSGEPVSEFASFTVAQLESEIDLTNAEREDELKIVPDGRKKADLIAALEADKTSAISVEVTD